ncbi:MAG: enoyl-CoA hydratase/isomerase family protein, partial [Blastocatellia bacterium]|nr:enoyl-CoA hydratase/isomerase family protein [Blastocatellia bacterium]
SRTDQAGFKLMSEPVFISCERIESYAVIAIDRLAQTAITELFHALTELQNDPEVRSIILTGAFSAGAELADEQADKLASLLEGMGKPVIAAIDGEVSGGGCELALHCTWRIASASASFSFTPASREITTRLARMIGKARALELILTGEPVGAAEALRYGLVERVVEDGVELLRAARESAGQIGRNAPLAVKSALAAVKQATELSLSEGMRLESSLFSFCCGTEDFREGVHAFLEKRDPVFKGE